MASKIRRWPNHWLRASLLKKKRDRGFTLLELLVAMFIGGIIVTLLLYTAVELLQTNQREAARSDTQRDMQQALDYIATDLREAVFVYDGTCLAGPGTIAANQPCPGVVNFLPTDLNTGTSRVVLAFWRVDPLPQAYINACVANAAQLNATPQPTAVRGIPCISRRMYTLVAYSIDQSNPTGIWRGRARIRRYQLPQFSTTAPITNPPTISTGWVDPTRSGVGFLNWPGGPDPTTGAIINLQSLVGGRPPNTTDVTNPVLVDYADNLNATGDARAIPEPTIPATFAAPDPLCPRTPFDTNLAAASSPPFVLTPRVGGVARGLYACVRTGTTANPTQFLGAQSNLNQEVAVFIRGNAAGRPGIPANGSLLIPMETRVLTRGVLNKN